MRTFIVLIFCLFANIVDILADVEQLMKDTEVIPDVLSEAPKELLKIEFDGGLIVGNGEEFTPTQTKDTPKIEWNAVPDAYYTVIMINPDLPSREKPTMRAFLHWFIVNIPGMDIDKGEILDEYFGPGPPKTSGLLRYVFLVYKQPNKLVFDEKPINNTNIAGHFNFSPLKFAEKYGTGSPVAGNIFQAKWDEFVPTIHKQFGIEM